MPKSRTDYWNPKLTRNVERDQEHRVALRKLGWKSLVLWDCETKDKPKIAARILRFLEE